MSTRRFALATVILIGGGLAFGCGGPSTPPGPLSAKEKAAADARADATRNVIIQQGVQHSLPSPSPDYGAGIKY